MSSGMEARENAADDGLIWAAHANEEVGNWEVFLPDLVRLYRVITDPEIAPYYSFRVDGAGRDARYAEPDDGDGGRQRPWRNPMLKFMLASRSKPEHTKERFFFEWGIIHVALMITTPTVTQTFRRYAQHFAVDGLDAQKLLFPFSEMEWENMADHWLETWEDLVIPFKADDYPERMQPHDFGDSNFDLQLMIGEELYAEDGYYAGGVKLVHFVHKRDDMTLDEFKARFREHADVVVAEGVGKGLVRKYVQNVQTQGDPAYFKGTLFERGGVNRYAGVEEIWLDDLDAVVRVCTDPARRALLLESYGGFADDQTYSMVTTERVVFDWVTPGHISPRPAVLAAGPLEAAVDAQGYAGWNVPGWEKRARQNRPT